MIIDILYFIIIVILSYLFFEMFRNTDKYASYNYSQQTKLGHADCLQSIAPKSLKTGGRN